MMPRLTSILTMLGVLAACAPMPGEVAPGAATSAASGVTTTRRAYPVYFEPLSAALDDAAVKGLREASELARAHPSVPLVVIGFSDPAGSPSANIALSQLRASVVADELKRNGVAESRIRQEWRGSAEVAGIESRRVEIRIDHP